MNKLVYTAPQLAARSASATKSAVMARRRWLRIACYPCCEPQVAASICRPDACVAYMLIDLM